jgi:protein associated with RNAse G/E
MLAGHWELDRWTWRDTTLLARFAAGDYFSVSRFFDAGGGGWYVDFVQPYRRTPIGIDTFDLLLDLIVTADLSGYRWKDEDEYARGRRLGLIDDALHQSVDAAREQVISLIESRQGPFADDYSSWRPDPAWPTPVLPIDAVHP